MINLKMILCSLPTRCLSLLKDRIVVHRKASICILRGFTSRKSLNTKSDVTLLRHLKARIQASGPVSVAEYMKEVLTNPLHGYYMHQDVFGSGGDFITSPEISQMFGELIGVWCVNEWMANGSPGPIQVVELGPGRGTLAQDMLRVFSQFKDIKDHVSLHLVEVSPKMSDIQAANLTQSSTETTDLFAEGDISSDGCYRQEHTETGTSVSWYRHLEDVPKGFSFYVAHEFFDALPIYKFQKTPNGWSEVLVDMDDESGELRMVLSPGPTIHSKALLHVSPDDTREHIEVCPIGGVMVQQIASRIYEDGGFALIADYGHDGNKTDTFRAFKKHGLHDPLKDPGSADLTADVDFSYLRKLAEVKNVNTHGPITQREFLINMGIHYRLRALIEKANSKDRKDLLSGFDMITNPDKMGDRFKFMALHHNPATSYIPAGFKSLLH